MNFLVTLLVVSIIGILASFAYYELIEYGYNNWSLTAQLVIAMSFPLFVMVSVFLSPKLIAWIMSKIE